MYKNISLLSLLYVTLFFSLSLDSGLMNNYIFPSFVENKTLYLSIVVLLILVSARHIHSFKIFSGDILIVLFFSVFVVITLKNTMISGTIKQMTVIFYPIFFFIGRMLYFSRKVSFHSLLMVMFTAALINILASALVMANKFLMLSLDLIVGSTILGPSIMGSFATRATGFYYSPLTFSAFMVMPFFIGVYYYIYGKGWVKHVVVVPILGIILALSRGTLLAILLGILFLFLYGALNGKKIISNKYYLKLFILSGAFVMVISQYFSVARFIHSITLNISVGTRLDRFLEDATIFFSNITDLMIGNSSNLLGGDSDFIVMLFTIGLPAMFLFCFTIFKLVYETIKLEMITYFIGGAIVAKGFESLFAGSTWGPPSSFYIFLILGYLYSHKKQYSGVSLITPSDLGYKKNKRM
jgi:hypothetical protein